MIEGISNNDNLILKVNDKYAPNLVNATQGDEISLSVMVNKDDKVTLTTPSRSNLWYKSIEVKYTSPAFLTNEVIENGDEAMIYGVIDEDIISDIDEVGFYYSIGAVSGFEGYEADDASSTVYSSIKYNNTDYSVDGKLLFGTVLTDIDEAEVVYVYTFAKAYDGEVYSTYTKVK